MTPKEKSRELVNKFTDPVRWKLGQENVTQRAKECALIAVDEIISVIDNELNFKSYLYFKEVKTEIQKL